MVDLGIASERQILVQQLCNSIAGASGRAIVLSDAIGALCQFVLDIVAD